MPKIDSIKSDLNITSGDKLLGSDAAGGTRNYVISDVTKFFKDKIFSAYEVGAWKPEPGLFLHAAKAMNVDPADCWVVEDSTVGIQAANNANMKCVHYSPDLSHSSPLASVHIQHMSELMQTIT